jgi:RNA-directed DNA polymerase
MTGARAPGRTKRSERAPGAASHRKPGWNQIDWKRAEREVKRLQQRIAKATMDGRWGKVRALQRLLTRSYFGKALAVRRATTNRGSKTPGVDGIIWKTPAQKYQAIHRLRARGYQPQPLRRVYIDKRDKKAKRPLGIPTMIDRSMQALYLLALDPVAETIGDRSSYGFRPRRSTHDAIARCFTLLSRQDAPTWILEADIRSCFDEISHPMLEERIPIEKSILHKWLKAGYMQEAVFHRTEAGTPQGGILTAPTQSQTWGVVDAGDRNGVADDDPLAAHEDLPHHKSQHLLAVHHRGTRGSPSQPREKALEVLDQGEVGLTVDGLRGESIELGV